MARPIHRIDSVAVGDGARLTVAWDNGASATIDLSGWIATGADRTAPLKDRALFARAEVFEYGSAVAWDEDGEIAIDSLHLEMLAEQQRDFGRPELMAWQQTTGLSNNEAADLLGISPATWLNYKNGSTRIPGAIAIACRAVQRDRLLFEAHYRPRMAGRPAASSR